MSVRHRTKVDLAVQALRERLHSGELQPGQRLRVDELTAELGMSPTPIREALRLLQADRLVEHEAHRGVRVAQLSRAGSVEVYRLRGLLEAAATEAAIEHLTAETLDRIQRLHEEHRRACAAGGIEEIAECNVAWHWAIYEASGSELLVDFIRRLWRMFPWRTALTLPGRSESSLHHHEDIMQAIIGRDPALAAERMRFHILSSQQDVIGAFPLSDGRDASSATGV